MNLSFRIILLILSIALSWSEAGAQELTPDGAGTTTDTARVDTTLFDNKGELLSFTPVTDSVNYEQHLSQNPTKALFKSALIPGWGQLGNGSIIKAVIFAGMDATMIAAAIHHGRKASDYKRQFEEAEDLELRRAYYELYLDRKDNRNAYTWYAVIVTFLSMFDAYVDAHLSGFPERDQSKSLSFDVGGEVEQPGIKATVNYSF